MSCFPATARMLAAAMGVLLLAGCASGPRVSSDDRRGTVVSTGQQLARDALALLGRPYRYGGSGPDTFDCSGLVHFVHAGQGIRVPRTTAEQFRAAQRIDQRRRSPGDLLFFRVEGRKVSHVGIYVGDGQFVHAPQSGRPVEARRLDDPWYRSRLVGVGRLY